jgi:phasin family protein
MHRNMALSGKREAHSGFPDYRPSNRRTTMYSTPDQMASANKANIESLMTLANTAFASAERLAALNLSTARNLLEDTVINAKALMGAKDVQELMNIQAAIAQPTVEKAVAYSRSVYEIASATQEELTKVFEAQFAEANKTMTSALDKAVKNAPAGSDVAVAAVKSAIAAANSAYDSMTKAAKQVAEIAEANVAAATSATVKAVSAAPKAKKAA